MKVSSDLDVRKTVESENERKLIVLQTMLKDKTREVSLDSGPYALKRVKRCFIIIAFFKH